MTDPFEEARRSAEDAINATARSRQIAHEAGVLLMDRAHQLLQQTFVEAGYYYKYYAPGGTIRIVAKIKDNYDDDPRDTLSIAPSSNGMGYRLGTNILQFLPEEKMLEEAGRFMAHTKEALNRELKNHQDRQLASRKTLEREDALAAEQRNKIKMKWILAGIAMMIIIVYAAF